MTEKSLINAFGGESQAHMRYLHFAGKADKEGFPNVTRLFHAIAHAEYIQAHDHYNELKHLDGGFVANSMDAAHEIAENLEETLNVQITRPVNITVHIEPDIPDLRK